MCSGNLSDNKQICNYLYMHANPVWQTLISCDVILLILILWYCFMEHRFNQATDQSSSNIHQTTNDYRYNLVYFILYVVRLKRWPVNPKCLYTVIQFLIIWLRYANRSCITMNMHVVNVFKSTWIFLFLE